MHAAVNAESYIFVSFSDVLCGTDENMLNQRAQPLRLLFTDQVRIIKAATPYFLCQHENNGDC